MSYMKNIKVWGLAFSVMLLISGLAVADAFAAPQWTLNGAPISSAVATTGTGTLEFTDTGGFFGTTVSVKCTVTTTGSAGPGATDTTSTVTVSSCMTVAGTCGSPSAAPANLPWKTELVTAFAFPEDIVRDAIKADGKGAPGYTVSCTVLGSRITDTCTSERVQPDLTLNFSPVPLHFDVNSGTLDCSLGGHEAGHLRKSISVSAKSGTLTASD